MFVVASSAVGPQEISPQDNALLHSFEVLPDVKDRLQWYNGSMIASPSSKISEGKADHDSVRIKLRDSLTSALEMVVSKQLVKNVLGKMTKVEVADEEKFAMQLQSETDDDVKLHKRNEDVAGVRFCNDEVRRLNQVSNNDQFVTLHVDSSFERKVDVTVDEIEGRFLKAFPAEQSGHSDSHFEVDRSPLIDLEREESVQDAEEPKGGLQLMEQARKVAWNVELNLFAVNGGVNKKYKEKARSLLFNLKDKSNPELRARVFEGEINPEILVRMSAAQLASKELCRWRTAKAEEFASMVVLTDGDMDSRRIVKKTHKGEFQLMVEGIVFPASSGRVAIGSVAPANVNGGAEGEGDTVFGEIGKRGSFRKISENSSVEDGEVDRKFICQRPVSRETEEKEKVATEEAPYDVGRDLSLLTSRDEYTVDHRLSSKEESSRPLGTDPDEVLEIITDAHPERSADHMWVNFPPSLQNHGMQGPTGIFGEPDCVNGSYLSENKERYGGSSVWEGSLQLSATRSVSIDGFYKSGERLELKDWPQSVEVKGRVRLGVLDKFLQDLQLSRSRTVTVLSLCPADGQGDVKQMGAYLKEVADHYAMGDRAGFAEPKPGFELYLLAPGSACLNLFSLDQRNVDRTLEREDETLVGVVVCRKSQSQGILCNRGSEQNFNVKKVALWNPRWDSPMGIHAQPLHRINSPNAGGLTTSVMTASTSSLVHVSGDTLMQSMHSREGTAALMAPVNRVVEHAPCAMAESCLPRKSLDQEDLPPGFVPQQVLSIPVSRSAILNVGTKQDVQGFQASKISSVPVPPVLEGNIEVLKKQPPGIWSKTSAELSTGAMQSIHSASQQEEDDLPEFNFDAEVEAQQTREHHVAPRSQMAILSGHIQNIAPQFVTGLPHISDPSNRYQSHHDIRHRQPPFIEFQSMLNRLHSRHSSQQKDFSAPQLFAKFTSSEGRNRGEMDRETVARVFQLSNSGPMLPGNGLGPRGLSRRVSTEELGTCEKMWNLAHIPSGVLGLSTPMSHGFLSPGATISSGASHTASPTGHFQSNCIPDWCPPTLKSHLGYPHVGPTLSLYNSLQNNKRLPLHMVTQHPHLSMKNGALGSVGRMSLLQQEVRQLEWSEPCTSNPSEWLPSNSEHVYPRSKRKLDLRESLSDNAQASEFNLRNTKHSRARLRGREYLVEPTPSSPKERRARRSRSANPASQYNLSKDPLLDTQTISGLLRAKFPKRERERDQ